MRDLLVGAADWLEPGGSLFVVAQCHVPLSLMADVWARDNGGGNGDNGRGNGGAMEAAQLVALDGRFAVWRFVRGATKECAAKGTKRKREADPLGEAAAQGKKSKKGKKGKKSMEENKDKKDKAKKEMKVEEEKKKMKKEKKKA